MKRKNLLLIIILFTVYFAGLGLYQRIMVDAAQVEKTDKIVSVRFVFPKGKSKTIEYAKRWTDLYDEKNIIHFDYKSYFKGGYLLVTFSSGKTIKYTYMYGKPLSGGNAGYDFVDETIGMQKIRKRSPIDGNTRICLQGTDFWYYIPKNTTSWKINGNYYFKIVIGRDPIKVGSKTITFRNIICNVPVKIIKGDTPYITSIVDVKQFDGTDITKGITIADLKLKDYEYYGIHEYFDNAQISVKCSDGKIRKYQINTYDRKMYLLNKYDEVVKSRNIKIDIWSSQNKYIWEKGSDNCYILLNFQGIRYKIPVKMVDKHIHKLTFHKSQGATPYHFGHNDYYECKKCKKYYSDKEGIKEIEYSKIQFWSVFEEDGFKYYKEKKYAVRNGLVDKSFTGFHKETYSNTLENPIYEYYVNGVCDIRGDKKDVVSGIINGIHGWWYIERGVMWRCNTVAKNVYGWWVIKDGKVDFGFNGIARNEYGQWYCVGGKVDFSYCGTYIQDGITYKIENGKVI